MRYFKYPIAVFIFIFNVNARAENACEKLLNKELRLQDLGTPAKPTKKVNRSVDKANEIDTQFKSNKSVAIVDKLKVDISSISYFGSSVQVFNKSTGEGSEKMVAFSSVYKDREELVLLNEDCTINEVIISKKNTDSDKQMRLTANYCRHMGTMQTFAGGGSEDREFKARCLALWGRYTEATKETPAKCFEPEIFAYSGGKVKVEIHPFSVVHRFGQYAGERYMEKYEDFIQSTGAKFEATRDNYSLAAVYCDKYDLIKPIKANAADSSQTGGQR